MKPSLVKKETDLLRSFTGRFTNILVFNLAEFVLKGYKRFCFTSGPYSPNLIDTVYQLSLLCRCFIDQAYSILSLACFLTRSDTRALCIV